MKLAGKKIGVLIESDFYEKEIFYYEHRFPEEGAELHFLTRLWGQPSITFRGHEEKYPFECRESFEGMDGATAWRLRQALADTWPAATVKSMGPLASSARGRPTAYSACISCVRMRAT